MDRRSALKAIGCTLLAPILSNNLTFLNVPKKSSNISSTKWLQDWMKENQHWIIKEWILEAKQMSDPEKIFWDYHPHKVYRSFMGFTKTILHAQIHRNRDLRTLIEDTIYSLVMSRKSNSLPEIRMSGFYEQVGRMPTKEDRVQVFYTGNNFINSYTDYNHNKTYIVECLLRVDISRIKMGDRLQT